MFSRLMRRLLDVTLKRGYPEGIDAVLEQLQMNVEELEEWYTRLASYQNHLKTGVLHPDDGQAAEVIGQLRQAIVNFHAVHTDSKQTIPVLPDDEASAVIQKLKEYNAAVERVLLVFGAHKDDFSNGDDGVRSALLAVKNTMDEIVRLKQKFLEPVEAFREELDRLVAVIRAGARKEKVLFPGHDDPVQLTVFRGLPLKTVNKLRYLVLADFGEKKRSLLELRLHPDKGLLTCPHYNLVFGKPKLNIHIIPSEYDEEYRKLLAA